jgi:hypothetical protein
MRITGAKNQISREILSTKSMIYSSEAYSALDLLSFPDRFDSICAFHRWSVLADV